MKRLFGVPTALSVALALSTAMAGPAAMSRPGPAPGHARVQARVQARLITLITGTQLTLGLPRPGAPASSDVSVPTPGACEEIIGTFAISIGGTAYQIPVDAMPYLGRGLDPRLFSVRALASAEKGGKLPVHVAYRGTTPQLPGVTITSAAHGDATGYLTASSAKVFGAALARQYATDHGHASYGTDGLFADGTSISLAGGTASRARGVDAAGAKGTDGLARQASPTGQVVLGGTSAADRSGVRVLTFRARDDLGHPADNGAVVLVSVDDSNFFEALNGFTHGTAAFQLPPGHYFAIAGFVDDPAIRWVIDPQITVTRDMTVHADERLATSKITMVTPRPAVPLETFFEIRRTAAAGPPDDFTTAACFQPEWVSPTRVRPTIGKMRTVTAQVLMSPTSATTPYVYRLSHLDASGLVHRQRYLIRAASLATVQMRDYSAAPIPFTAVNTWGLIPSSKPMSRLYS